jgi:hypothetical protein
MKKVVRLSESDLARVVSRIINEQPTPGPVVPSTSQQAQTPRQTSQTPGPQMPAAQRTPFNPQHKGTFEVDCKAGLSKLGYGGKLSKEGNKLFVDLFCNPKYRNR